MKQEATLNRHRGFIAAILAALIVTGCASSGGLRPAEIPQLSQIKTVETAQRSLVILQDLRVAARDSVARYYVERVHAGGDPAALKVSILDKFEAADAKFRSAWALLDSAAKLWTQTANRASFDTQFETVISLLLQLQSFSPGVANGAH